MKESLLLAVVSLQKKIGLSKVQHAAQGSF